MDKKGTISELEQKIEIHKETSIKAKYEAKKNTTKIYVKEKGQDEKLKEKKSGLMLLQMVTNEGKLNIEY